MVRARLHIICGNCGASDMFKYSIVTYLHDELKKECERVTIICENCSTIHSLEDNAEED